MTKLQWIQSAKDQMDLLCRFIAKWHPGSKEQNPELMPITAPNSEGIRRMIAEDIAKEQSEDPVLSFRQAIDIGDVGAAIALLGGAWCGVPESTSCWQIPGFAEAVDLMDDPPEDPEESQ